MKASNIILISLIGSITLIILTAMMEVRLKGSTDGWRYTDAADSKKTDLPAFQYLVIHDVQQVELEASGRFGMELMWEKGKSAPVVVHHLKGDTLHIDHIELTDGSWSSVKILVPDDQVKWIDGERSRITIRGLNAERLVLQLNEANVSIESNDQTGIRLLRVNGINRSSVFTGSSVMLDTLDLHLENSRAQIEAPVHKLKGAMASDSELSIRRVIDFEFKQDDSSRLHHWN